MRTETSVKMFATDEEAITIAREVAADRATIAWHDGDPGHRGMRITGCYPEQARAVGSEIESRLFAGRDPETGLYPADSGSIGYTEQAGWACVWIR